MTVLVFARVVATGTIDGSLLHSADKLGSTIYLVRHAALDPLSLSVFFLSSSWLLSPSFFLSFFSSLWALQAPQVLGPRLVCAPGKTCEGPD